MWPNGVVVTSPALDDDAGVLKRVENLPVSQLVAKSRIEALDEAVLPGAARAAVRSFRGWPATTGGVRLNCCRGVRCGSPNFGECPMRQDPLAFPSVWSQNGGFANPLFCLYREAGLAAVAVELNLQVYELAPEVAEAVERGAAALFLGGYGPYSTLTRQSAGVGAQARHRKRRALRNQGKTIFKFSKRAKPQRDSRGLIANFPQLPRGGSSSAAATGLRACAYQAWSAKAPHRRYRVRYREPPQRVGPAAMGAKLSPLLSQSTAVRRAYEPRPEFNQARALPCLLLSNRRTTRPAADVAAGRLVWRAAAPRSAPCVDQRRR